MKFLKYSVILFLFTFLISSCENEFQVIEDLSNQNYELVDQDSSKFIFPERIKGNYTLVGYIFTNCPDICPLTTNNMRILQENMKEEEIENINLLSISFDPEVDKPDRLKKYAELRSLDLSNWDFVTGEKSTVDSLMKDVGVLAVPGDSTITPSGEKILYFVHTDRISLFDKEGRIIKNYKGSQAPIDKIMNDLKKLED